MQNQTEKIKAEIKSLLRDNASLAVQKIQKVLLPGDQETDDELFLHDKNLFKLGKDYDKGILTDDDYDKQLNKLTLRILHFIRDLRPEQIRQNYKISEQIRENILIVCKEEREKMMLAFFPDDYFPNVKTHFIGENLPNFKETKIVIFEDLERPYSKVKNNVNLEKYLKAINETNTYMLYFGSSQPYDEYGDIAYFSNSKFSLHARLKELLDYIKYSKTV